MTCWRAALCSWQALVQSRSTSPQTGDRVPAEGAGTALSMMPIICTYIRWGQVQVLPQRKQGMTSWRSQKAKRQPGSHTRQHALSWARHWLWLWQHLGAPQDVASTPSSPPAAAAARHGCMYVYASLHKRELRQGSGSDHPACHTGHLTHVRRRHGALSHRHCRLSMHAIRHGMNGSQRGKPLPNGLP